MLRSRSHPKYSKKQYARSAFEICVICNQAVFKMSTKDTWATTMKRHRGLSRECGIMRFEANNVDMGVNIESDYVKETYVDEDVASDTEFSSDGPQILNIEELGMKTSEDRVGDFLLSEMDVDELIKEGRFRSIGIDEVKPHNGIIEKQEKLLQFFDAKRNKTPFGNLRSPISKIGQNFKWEDDADLLKLATVCGMSDAQGDLMLSTFQRILNRWGVSSVSLHSDFKYMRGKLDKVVERHFPIHTINFSFNEEIFGTKIRGGDLKKIHGTMFDMKDILAEALLDCDPIKFLRDFNESCPPPGLNANFGNSPMWKAICEDMKKYPEFEGVKPIPICLVISSDEAMASRSKSEQPLDFGILNSIGDDFRKYLVGYTPLNLPYSDEVLSELLKARGIIHKVDRSRILKWQKRKVMLDFIYQAFESITKLGENCFEVLIGRGTSQVRCVAFIHVLLISGDGQFLDSISGTGARRKHMQCRLCTTRCLYALDEPEGGYTFRDDFEHAFVCAQLEDVFLRRWKWFIETQGSQGKFYRLSIDDKKWLQLGDKYGIVEGRNSLYKLFGYWRGRGITSFHKSLPPDFLHVIEKGLLEKTFMWSLVIVLLIQELSINAKEDNYQNSLSLLDARITSFIGYQSFWFTR